MGITSHGVTTPSKKRSVRSFEDLGDLLPPQHPPQSFHDAQAQTISRIEVPDEETIRIVIAADSDTVIPFPTKPTVLRQPQEPAMQDPVNAANTIPDVGNTTPPPNEVPQNLNPNQPAAETIHVAGQRVDLGAEDAGASNGAESHTAHNADAGGAADASGADAAAQAANAEATRKAAEAKEASEKAAKQAKIDAWKKARAEREAEFLASVEAFKTNQNSQPSDAADLFAKQAAAHSKTFDDIDERLKDLEAKAKAEAAKKAGATYKEESWADIGKQCAKVSLYAAVSGATIVVVTGLLRAAAAPRS